MKMVEATKKTEMEMPALAPSERPPSDAGIGSEVPVDVGAKVEVWDGSVNIVSLENEAAVVWVADEFESGSGGWCLDGGGGFSVVCALDVEATEYPGGGVVAVISVQGALDDGEAELAAGLLGELGVMPTAWQARVPFVFASA